MNYSSSNSHYVEFRAPRDADYTEIPMLLGRIVSTVHGYNVENFSTEDLGHEAASEIEARRIAIGLVGYDDAPEAPMPGTGIRLFADEATLADFLASRHGSFAKSAMLPGAVRPVPESHGHAVFVRDRSDERGTDGWIMRSEARFIRRQQARGVPEAVLKEEVQRRRDTLIEQGRGQNKTVPYLRLRSGSNTQTFSLFIRKRIVPQACNGVVNTYGLAGSQVRSVPFF